MALKKVEPILSDTYLAVIKNSVGAKTWCDLYASVDGRRKNITKRGDLSCAFFVSSILVIFKLITEIHTTVAGTEKDLINSGWHKIKNPKLGAIIIWEKAAINNSLNRHLGFYIGQNKAVSNSSKTGSPIVHHLTYGTSKSGTKRKIEAIYWHHNLKA